MEIGVVRVKPRIKSSSLNFELEVWDAKEVRETTADSSQGLEGRPGCAEDIQNQMDSRIIDEQETSLYE